MDDQSLTPSDIESSKPAPRRKMPPRSKVVAPAKASEVVEVTCAPRHLQPWGVLLAAVIVLAVVVFAVVSYTGKPARAWNAVFLTNGQVYFGHISGTARDAIELRDVYYLQVTARPAAEPSSRATEGSRGIPDVLAQNTDLQKPDITLVKLGNELHGPTDAMSINREHVLFTEELRNDSTIVQAIAAAQARAATPTPPATPEPQTPPASSVEAPAEGVSAPAVE